MIDKKLIINFSSIIYYLIPLSLLTGPLIPEIILLIINLVFLYYSIKEKDWFYFNNNFTKFFLLFYIYLISRSFFSENPYLSLESSLFYFRFGIFALATWFLIINKRNFIKEFALFLIIAFVIATIDGYYQYFNNSTNIFGFESPGTRMSLTFNDNLTLGSFLARIFPLLFAVMIYSFNKTNLNLIYLFFTFILIDTLIYLSGERTAFGLITLATVFLILVINEYKLLRLFALAVSIIIITIITILSPEIRARNIEGTINQMTSKITNPLNDKISDTNVIFSPGHHTLIMTAINMFKDKPLFGHGPKLYRELCNNNKYKYNDNSCSTHPHNNYIQALSEIGIVGLGFILILLMSLSLKILNHLYNKIILSKNILSDYEIALIACFLLTLWPFFPSQNLFNNWINIIYYLPVGFYLQKIYSKNQFS